MIGFLILLFCAISFLNSALLVVKSLHSILRAGLRPVRKPTQPAVSGLSPPGTAKKWVLAERKPLPPASGSEPPPGTPSGENGRAAEGSRGAGRGARRRRSGSGGPADMVAEVGLHSFWNRKNFFGLSNMVRDHRNDHMESVEFLKSVKSSESECSESGCESCQSSKGLKSEMGKSNGHPESFGGDCDSEKSGFQSQGTSMCGCVSQGVHGHSLAFSQKHPDHGCSPAFSNMANKAQINMVKVVDEGGGARVSKGG